MLLQELRERSFYGETCGSHHVQRERGTHEGACGHLQRARVIDSVK